MMQNNLEDYIQLSGNLFYDVQTGKIFTDSKTFVDSIPKFDTQKILSLYNDAKYENDFDLKKFILANFSVPNLLNNEIQLNLPRNRTMEEHINLLWNHLERVPQKSSNKFETLISLPYSYIVPGGRFREIYYWDSYFTILGLLASGRIETAENMVKNFAYLIDTIGHIPNGNRLYYITRSQPPFFAAMVDLIAKYKNDYKWAEQFINEIENEYLFWMNRTGNDNKANLRTVRLKDGSIVNRYYDSSNLPRHESFTEDFSLVQKFPEEERTNLFRSIRAMCESGWDFSSRWFADSVSIETCNSLEIAPVDLNSILYFTESFLARLFDQSGSKAKSDLYSEKAFNRHRLINSLFWNNEKKFFMDYNWKSERHTNVPSLAGCYPLYFGAADEDKALTASELIESSFLKDGGLTTTLNHTGQQWDAPNGWAPLQWISINGLKRYGINQLAEKIQHRWLKINEDVFSRTGKMFEKYDVYDTSLHAGGGEYQLQDGFGWTNGVALALLKNFR
jgi:alpha,alpha-trehalase